MAILFYISLFLYVSALSVAAKVIDFDFWARIVVGKTFFQTGKLLSFDFQSFGPTREWFDHEWGASLIFYSVLDKFGDWGILLFKTIILFLVFFIITRIILLRRRHKNPDYKESFSMAPFNILFFMFLIQSIMDVSFSTIRCQMITFLFFMIWFYTLEKVRLEGNFRLLWILPSTMLLWSNIHGGCFTGLGLLFIYAVGEFLNKKPYKPYIIAFLISILVMFINPYGLKYVYFLFYAITLKRPNITEWQPLFSSIHLFSFLKYKIWALLIMLISGFYLVKKYLNTPCSDKFYRLKNFYNSLDKTKALVLIIMLILSIKTLRLTPFFAFSAGAFLYDDIYNKIFNKKLPNVLNNLKEIILFFLILISFLYTTKKWGIETSLYKYPYIEAEYLKINNLKGNLLANFHFGSYLAYKLYPDNFIFMDGRYEETYEPELLLKLKNIYVSNNWKKELDSYHIDYIIAEKSYPDFVSRLKADKDWNLAIESKDYALFLNKNIKPETRKQPPLDIKYYQKQKWDTNIDWR